MRLTELPSNAATIICSHVFADEREVKLVKWDDDGLCMLCGAEDHNWDNTSEARVVGLGHLLSRQVELSKLSLELGQEAEKATSGHWIVSTTEDQE